MHLYSSPFQHLQSLYDVQVEEFSADIETAREKLERLDAMAAPQLAAAVEALQKQVAAQQAELAEQVFYSVALK